MAMKRHDKEMRSRKWSISQLAQVIGGRTKPATIINLLNCGRPDNDVKTLEFDLRVIYGRAGCQ